MRLVLSFVFVLLISVVNGSFKCSSYEFQCEDGGCIDKESWCDTDEDCLDGSDEKYCKKSSMFKSDPNKCSSRYLKCDNGPCIPLSGRCDGYKSCEDSSDEKNCGSTDTSSEGEHSSKSTNSKAETTSKTVIHTTFQPTVKVEFQSVSFSDSLGELNKSIDVVYPVFQHSDFSHQLEKARNWLISQRTNDYGWGDETPRALTALYLSDLHRPIYRNESDLLMVKQLEVQLSLEMSRNGTKAVRLSDLAFYINALLASCKNPKNFYGENLVRTLRNGVDAAHRNSAFVNPSVYLTLCLNNASLYDDTRKLHEIFLSRNNAIVRIDIQALALLTVTCVYRDTKLITASQYEGFRNVFLQRMNSKGIPGNVYEASILIQALQELKTSLPGLLEFILKQQHEDGSFGGVLATYLALPVLAGRSLLRINEHCGQQYSTDMAPIEVLKNTKRRKINVHYSLKYGDPPEMTQTIQMQVAEGINFLDVMRLAQEVNPKFRFMLDGNIPVVYSIGEVPNDAEKGIFWTLYLVSNRGGASRLIPYTDNIKNLIPHPGDEYIFWMKSL